MDLIFSFYSWSLIPVAIITNFQHLSSKWEENNKATCIAQDLLV